MKSKNLETIAVVESGKTVTVRLAPQQPGETREQALARQDEKTARIKAQLAQQAIGKILNKSQAEAVYSAMVALNNVGASIEKITLPAPYYVIDVVAYSDQITVRKGLKESETYESQAAFATAYDLS